MKTNIILAFFISLLLSCTFLSAEETICLVEADFGSTSKWEYSSYPLPYLEEKSCWGTMTELNGYSLENEEPFWGICGLKKNDDGKNYFHELHFAPFPLIGSSNMFLEFSYFAEGLDKGENLQWCLVVDSTNIFGSAIKSSLDTSSLWERVMIPLPPKADHAGIYFKIKQQGSTDFAGIGKIRIWGTPFPERTAPPILNIKTSLWDRVELEILGDYNNNLLCKSFNVSDFITNQPNSEVIYSVGDYLRNCQIIASNVNYVEDEDIVPGNTYYYKAWEKTESHFYSCGTYIKEVTVPELPVVDMAVPSVEAGTLNDETAVLLRPEIDEKLTVLVDVATSRDFLRNPGLFFSEYGKGSGNNRYVEIYNPCPEDVELDGMSVCIFKNGSVAASQTLSLFGSLPSFETLLISNNKANAELTNVADIVSAKIDFTGNDAVALIKGDEILDIIGVIGEDPGTAWPIGEYATGTANHTIIRYPYVNRGSSSWRSKEWEVLEKDFFNDLKNHECSETREGTIVYEALCVPEDGLTLTNLSVDKLYYLRAKTAYKGATGAYGGVCGPFQLIPEPGALLLLVLFLIGSSSLRSFPL